MVHNHYLPSKFTLTLWLVPSDAIRKQTLKILKDKRHPLTHSLSTAIGAIETLDIEESLYLKPATLDSAHTIIVATMQSFKRDDKTGLRVHRENGELMEHFTRHPKAAAEGKHSLVDALRLRHPFIILDEAHNNGSPLAMDVLAAFRPSAVLELTATPDRQHTPSNVLRSISASVLQAEDMLKLPLELSVHEDWKICLRDAVNRRAQLQKDAGEEEKLTQEKIRPVLFIQAEKNIKGQENMTPDKVKEHLIADFHFTENQIAICTGAIDELGDRNMGDENFPAVIITVDKLREGWDCPFAYVLMTFRNTTSSTAVEQVVGRILRMPQVKRKRTETLNRAYCYACSNDFSTVVRSLKDGLVEAGFERQDTADILVLPDSGHAEDDDLFSHNHDTIVPLPTVSRETTDAESGETITTKQFIAPDLRDFSPSLIASVELDPEAGTLTLRGKPSPALQKKLYAAIEKATDKDEAEKFKLTLDQELARKRTQRDPATFPSRVGEVFTIPLLQLKQGDFLDEFEESLLLEGEWTLTDDFDSILTHNEFSTNPEETKKYRFDLQQEKIQYTFYEEQDADLALISEEKGWTSASLTQWLDLNIDFPYSDQEDKVAWILRMVAELQDRPMAIEELAFRKYRLREAVRNKLRDGLTLIKQRKFSKLLESLDDFQVDRSGKHIRFADGRYAYNRAYNGSYQFQKHFFPQIGDLKGEGEEFDCATRIDQHPNVKWWVRNVEKQLGAFWLQTSRDRFFPDFIAELHDGTIAIIEYKGAHIAENKMETEKKDIGELWASRGGAKTRFAMVINKNWQELDQVLK